MKKCKFEMKCEECENCDKTEKPNCPVAQAVKDRALYSARNAMVVHSDSDEGDKFKRRHHL